jgi:hypothetical protein
MSRTEIGTLIALLIGVALTVAVLGAVARAQPVQQLSLRLREGQPGGRMQVSLTLRTYDTTGAVPPRQRAYYLRLPLGLRFDRAFLTPRWRCDGAALLRALDAHPSHAAFAQRVADLRPLVRTLARASTRADREALANARVCERAHLGDGKGLIDARRLSASLFADPIPVRYSLFWSHGAAPGALAGVAIVGAPDARAPIVRRSPVLLGVHAALSASIVPDPAPDGLYGYRVLLPAGPINGLDVSVAEASATATALELPRGACARAGRGRCTARERRNRFSFAVSACPPSGLLSVQAVSAYAPPIPTSAATVRLACPRFPG